MLSEEQKYKDRASEMQVKGREERVDVTWQAD